MHSHRKINLRFCAVLTLVFYLGTTYSLSQGTDRVVKTARTEIICETPTGTLFGTLDEPLTSSSDTLQKPLVLIIAGSGPTDRDGNNPIGGKNNSLKMLADGLTMRGIAVARYDKRGIAKSANAMQKEDDLRFETYINDAVDIVRQVTNNGFNARNRYSSVTIIGHSEGSLIGMLAAQKVGAQGFISLAGAGFPAAQIIRKQLGKQLPLNLVADSEKILKELEAGKTASTQAPPALYAIFRPSVQPYLVSWFRYDPREEVKRLRCPVLILQGSRDIQVSVDDANALHTAKPEAQFLIIDGMNHVLKAVSADMTEQMASYSNPTLPVVPQLIDTIAAFIQGLPKQK